MYRSPKVSVPGMVDELVAAERTPRQAANEIERALLDGALFLTSAKNPADANHKQDAIEFLQAYARWPAISIAADFAALRLEVGEVYVQRSEFERVCELGATLASQDIDTPLHICTMTRKEAVRVCKKEGMVPARTVTWDAFCDRVRDLADGWVDKKQGILKRGFDIKTIKRDFSAL
jgi:hypothetical protein